MILRKSRRFYLIHCFWRWNIMSQHLKQINPPVTIWLVCMKTCPVDIFLNAFHTEKHCHRSLFFFIPEFHLPSISICEFIVTWMCPLMARFPILVRFHKVRFVDIWWWAFRFKNSSLIIHGSSSSAGSAAARSLNFVDEIPAPLSFPMVMVTVSHRSKLLKIWRTNLSLCRNTMQGYYFL